MTVVPVQPKPAATEASDEPTSLAELGQMMFSAGQLKTSAEEPEVSDEEAPVEDADGEVALEADSPDDVDGLPDESDVIGSEEEEAPAKRTGSFSRVKASLAKSEREVSRLRGENSNLQAEVRRLASQARQTADDSGDIHDALMGIVARRLGVKADDARVVDELSRIAQDIVLETIPEGALDTKTDADILAARRDRIRRREEQDRQRKVEARFQQLERERDEARQAAVRQQVTATVQSRISAKAGQLAFLTAQTDVDPVSAVTEMADALVDGGHVKITGPDDAVRLIDRCAARLNDHYHEQARLLAARLNPTTDARPQAPRQTKQNTGTDTRQARDKRPPTKRTGTGSGGGGMGAPSGPREQETDDGDEDFATFAAREKRRILAQQQRRRGTGRRPS